MPSSADLHRRCCKQTTWRSRPFWSAPAAPWQQQNSAPSHPCQPKRSGRIYVVVRRSASTGSTSCCNEISKIMPPTQIIIDTDPGVDDALAFLLALASPEVKLEALTTTQGNVTLEKPPAMRLPSWNLSRRAYSGGAAVCAPRSAFALLGRCARRSGIGNSRLADPKARWCPNMRWTI